MPQESQRFQALTGREQIYCLLFPEEVFLFVPIARVVPSRKDHSCYRLSSLGADHKLGPFLILDCVVDVIPPFNTSAIQIMAKNLFTLSDC